MSSTKAKAAKRSREIPQMPFDEALKRLWASPPQHRQIKKQKPAKKS
jgi:hypothetical protein